jgi:hypothetical protein
MTPLTDDALAGWPALVGLMRTVDVTGQSGEGMVASGVQWPDGRTTLRWIGHRPPPGFGHTVHQVMTYPSADAALAVHGHGGLTTLVRRTWQQPQPELGLRLFAFLGRCGYHDDDREAVTWWGVTWGEHATDAVIWRRAVGRPSKVVHWPDGWAVAFGEEHRDNSARVRAMAWLPDEAQRVAATSARLVVRAHLDGNGAVGAATG